MFDISKELIEFYDNHLRLGTDLRGELAGARDLNLARLKAGLEEMENDTGKSHNGPIDWKNQGGYAMHTLNQTENNDYDIDVAVIFDRVDLPEDPLKARQRICEALKRKCTNFSKDPEARTNAVTIWYQDGYHIDFAIYRTYKESDGYRTTQVIEHASTAWKRRDPMQINDWFAKAVNEKSPTVQPLLRIVPKVQPGQLRRITRFLKRFCRSRSSYCLPGGMITSALAAEVYISDNDRDDVALYKTLSALKQRLGYSLKVWSPVDSSIELTAKSEHLGEVKRLKRELDKHFPKLSILHTPNCTREQARSAWDWIFNHEYWASPSSQPFAKDYREAVSKALGSVPSPFYIDIVCKLTHGERTPGYANYPDNGNALPKGIGLRFAVQRTNVPEPYDITWTVQNEGEEAEEAGQVKWERTGDKCETSTKYRGHQQMTCSVQKNGRTVARSSHTVNIR